jgi:hypothetical protein
MAAPKPVPKSKPRFEFERPALAEPKPDYALEHAYPIPGGTVTVVFARLSAGRLPSAFISAEPEEASPARTKLRDQVALLNALRAHGNERLLQVLIDADKALHPVFLVAQSVMEAKR